MKIRERETFKDWRLEEIRLLQEHKIALASYYSKIDAAQMDENSENSSDEVVPTLEIPPRPTKRPQRENEAKSEYKTYLSEEFKPSLEEWKVSCPSKILIIIHKACIKHIGYDKQ